MSTKREDIKFKNQVSGTPGDSRHIKEILNKAKVRGVEIDIRNIKTRLESLECIVFAMFGAIALLLVIILYLI